MLIICGAKCNIQWSLGKVVMIFVATVFGALIVTGIKILTAAPAFIIKKSGFICDFDSETDLDLDDWIFVNAIVEKEYAEKYDTWYPVLHIASYNKCEAPQNEVIEDL